MYIITKSGYKEIAENADAVAMDLRLSNRGKTPEDCAYVVETAPERYKVTENGLELKTDDELVAGGIITAEEVAEKKKAANDSIKREMYRVESDPLFFKEQAGEIPKGAWLAARKEIKQREIE